MDLANGIRILDERIDFWIEYVLNQEEIIEEVKGEKWKIIEMEMSKCDYFVSDK